MSVLGAAAGLGLGFGLQWAAGKEVEFNKLAIDNAITELRTLTVTKLTDKDNANAGLSADRMNEVFEAYDAMATSLETLIADTITMLTNLKDDITRLEG